MEPTTSCVHFLLSGLGQEYLCIPRIPFTFLIPSVVLQAIFETLGKLQNQFTMQGWSLAVKRDTNFVEQEPAQLVLFRLWPMAFKNH